MIRILTGKEGASRAAASGEDNLVVIVDALRSSATVAALLWAGAREVYLCSDPDSARRVSGDVTGSLLAGEWKGRTPSGFDLGNSPLEAAAASVEGKPVVFTSSNGAPILVACRGAGKIVMGGAANATAVADEAQRKLAGGGDVIIVAAGDKGHDCDEDMAASALLAEAIGPDIDPAQEELKSRWISRIAEEGLEQLFRNSEHGKELSQLGFDGDLTAAASPDLYPVVPEAVDFPEITGITVAKMVAKG